MHAVVRTYTGSSGAVAQLKPRAKEIEATIRRAPGFVAYYLLETPEGLTTLTVCQDRAGCDESSRLAAQWIRDNAPDVIKKAPQITQGELAIGIHAEQTVRT